MAKIIFYFVFVLIVILGSFTISKQAFGHGSGYETLPPKMLGEKKVTMEIASSVDNSTKRKSITFSMFDIDTGITVPDVTYRIKTIKNDNVLFDNDFHTDDGYLRFELVSSDTNQIKIEKKQKGTFFDVLAGNSNKYFEIQGNILGLDGLYKFQIDVISAQGYSNAKQTPVNYDAGISFPETSSIFADGKFSKSQIKVTSYYDTLEKTSYDKNTSTISFAMPFEWLDSNINQTSVVHQEIWIPKSFVEFFATKYDAYLNGIPIYEKALNIDDYSNEEYRIIHIVLFSPMLEKMKLENQDQTQMRFLVQPSKMQIFPVTIYTTNTQYKVNLSWNPPEIVSGSTMQFSFDIQDGYVISNKTISADYEFSITQQSKEIFKTEGTTFTTGKSLVSVPIPEETTGPVTINFDNVNNSGQNAGMSVIVTPEFPTGLLMAMTISFVGILLIQRIRSSDTRMKL